jgi:ketosteroid isomerase-like protein
MIVMTGPEFLTRLCEATNAHDVARIEACFAEDYVNVTPCHPARGFVGKEQVRRNWTAILAAVPDLVAEVGGWAEDGPRIWSEWEMRGTRRDGVPHLMRGVLVFTVRDGLATHLRFFLEPVDDAQVDADQAVARLTTGGAP